MSNQYVSLEEHERVVGALQRAFNALARSAISTGTVDQASELEWHGVVVHPQGDHA